METPTLYLIPATPPRLTSGAHRSPSRGTCIMEYISMITNDEFTDKPACTQISVAQAAQFANDSIGLVASRAEYLLPLLPRLLGAGPFPDTKRGAQAAVKLEEFRVARSFQMLASLPNSENYTWRLPRAHAAIRDFLVAVLDRYEELMGDIGEPVRRIEVVPVPEPAEAPVKEPSPAPAPAPEPAKEPEKEPVPA